MGCFISSEQNGNTSPAYDSVVENPTNTTDNDSFGPTTSPVDVSVYRRPRISAMLTSNKHLKLLNEVGEIPDEDEFDVIVPTDMETTELENAAFINSLENPKKFLQE